VALFVGVFLENLGIPVPGETVLLAAGFFCKQGSLRLAIVIPCAIVAAILGDNFGYLIGRKGGRSFIEKRGKYIGLTKKRLKKVDGYFHEHAARTIFLARFVSGLRVVAAIGAGVSRVPWPKFALVNAAGAIVWGTAIALLGFVFGQSWPLLEHWVGGTGLVLIAIAVAAIIFVVLRHRRGND
jgi:membrane protein DedA with SNARE-associated domain